MLNKLLKRCMPWMDKGRWYHVKIEGDTESGYNVSHDNIFSRYEVTGNGYLDLFFGDPEPKKTLVDIKVIPHNATGSYVLDGNYLQFEVEIVNNDGYAIEIRLHDGMTDYWFFMR